MTMSHTGTKTPIMLNGSRAQLLVAVTGSSAFILGHNTLLLSCYSLKQSPKLASSSLR